MQKSLEISLDKKLAMLDELIDAQVIGTNTADKIRNFYLNSKDSNQHTAKRQSKIEFSLLLFSIFAAILIGAGIMLIFAHNWDNFSPLEKSLIAFGQLLFAQALGFFALFFRPNSLIWREASAVFWLIATGASTALISQAYHIQGDLSEFLLLWIFLALPLIYLLKSKLVSLGVFVLAICFFVLTAHLNYRQEYQLSFHWFWLILLTLMPFYLELAKKHPQSLGLNLHNLLVSASAFLALAAFIENIEVFYFLGYFSLFAIIYIIGNMPLFDKRLKNHSNKQETSFWLKVSLNSFKKIAVLANIISLFIISNSSFWEYTYQKNWSLTSISKYLDFWINIGIFLLALLGFFVQKKSQKLKELSPFFYIFILFGLGFILFFSLPILQEYYYLWALFINLLILFLSLSLIKKAIKFEHFANLNLGLLLIALLIYIRFIDTDFSFITKGIVFILLGIGFLITNSIIVKKWRKNAK